MFSFGYIAGFTSVYNTRRLHYYSMQYSDGSSWVQCYKDNTSRLNPIPMPSIVSCKSRTANIRFYTTYQAPEDVVLLEICEVEIYGL